MKNMIKLRPDEREPKSFVESLFVDYTPKVAQGIAVKDTKSYYELANNGNAVTLFSHLSKRVVDFLQEAGIEINMKEKESFTPVKEIKNVPVEIMSTAWKKGMPTEVLIRISADDEETLWKRKKIIMQFLQKRGATLNRHCHWICTTKLAQKEGV